MKKYDRHSLCELILDCDEGYDLVDYVLELQDNSIPKEKIAEKIEELDKRIEKTEKLKPSATRYDTLQRLEYQAEFLQELLEDK